MQLMSTKISENTNIQLVLITVVAIIMVTASFVGMYYTLQADIEEAKNSLKSLNARAYLDSFFKELEANSNIN